MADARTTPSYSSSSISVAVTEKLNDGVATKAIRSTLSLRCWAPRRNHQHLHKSDASVTLAPLRLPGLGAATIQGARAWPQQTELGRSRSTRRWAPRR